MALKMTLNKKTHGSYYNAERLEDSLKVDYHFDFSNNERTVVSNTKKKSPKWLSIYLKMRSNSAVKCTV